MANLPENPVWDAGIYQLEATDVVEGGADGIDNIQAKALANRTQYLKEFCEALGDGKQPLDATLTALAALGVSADKLIYATGPDAFQLTTLTALARTFIAAASAAAARDVIGANLEPGAVGFFAMSGAPTGWLKCNGAAISRAAYANLFAAIDTTYGAGDGVLTFNLPDLRGEFIRGLDDGRGVDIGRAIGVAQGDAIRNIYGEFDGYTGLVTSSGVFGLSNPSVSNQTMAGTQFHSVIFDASTVVPTANENRPRNVALLSCIKY